MARPEGAADQPLLLIGKSKHDQGQRAQRRGIAVIGIGVSAAGIDTRLAWLKRRSMALGEHVNVDRRFVPARPRLKRSYRSSRACAGT